MSEATDVPRPGRSAGRPTPGSGVWDEYLRTLPLRERKKFRTKVAIQDEAIRLFRLRGFEATTVDEVAEAAEVAPRTVFRYFPTKEDLVLWDIYDDAAPAGLLGLNLGPNPLATLLLGINAIFNDLATVSSATVTERLQLIIDNPTLVSVAAARLHTQVGFLADEVARAHGRSEADAELRIAVSAMTAALLTAVVEWVRSGQSEPGGVLTTTADGEIRFDGLYSRLAEQINAAVEGAGHPVTRSG